MNVLLTGATGFLGGHVLKVLEKEHDATGIGVVRIARGSRYTTYWAVEFMADDR